MLDFEKHWILQYGQHPWGFQMYHHANGKHPVQQGRNPIRFLSILICQILPETIRFLYIYHVMGFRFRPEL